MSVNVLAFLLIFLAIGARVFLTYRLQSQKKALQILIEELRSVRVTLGHERERLKAAQDLFGFHKRHLDELPHKISEAQEELERLAKEEEEELKKEEGGRRRSKVRGREERRPPRDQGCRQRTVRRLIPASRSL